MFRHSNLIGGVHPADGKETAGCPVREIPLLERYMVPLQQHIGAPPELLVKKNDTVRRGQLLAAPHGFISAAVHSPTSGKVASIAECLSPAGTRVRAVEIASDGDDTVDSSLAPLEDWEDSSNDVLIERIRAAGIVGMGGAAFPTHVKLSPPPAKKIDVLILNGVECEPCLTADHRLMLEQREKILLGTRIIARILGVRSIHIAIEANKPDAVAHMSGAAAALGMAVVKLDVRYPQGAEKQLIYAVTRRKVPTGGLPMDVGCVVHNVGTAYAIADAVTEGRALTERVTTLAGRPVCRPGNWRVRVGTPLSKLFEMAGGVREDPVKIIMGGPMMGTAVYSLDVPLVKSSSGVVAQAADEVTAYTSGPCIRCGQCVEACPMRLMPGSLSVQIENERFELADEWRAMDCIECGCCAYMCPTNRPLVHHLRRAKSEITAKRRAATA